MKGRKLQVQPEVGLAAELLGACLQKSKVSQVLERPCTDVRIGMAKKNWRDLKQVPCALCGVVCGVLCGVLCVVCVVLCVLCCVFVVVVGCWLSPPMLRCSGCSLWLTARLGAPSRYRNPVG